MKNRPGLRALDGIAAALAGLLLLELHFAMQPPVGKVLPVGGVAAPAQDLQAGDDPAAQPTVAGLRAILLGRPLFDPTRRPPAGAAQDATAPVEPPRLSGIIVTPTNKIAIFSPAMGAPIIAGQNSRFGPFTVLAISGASVTIRGPDGVTVLRSDFGDPGAAEISTAKTTVLAGGVYLSLIKIALPDTRSWQGLPPAH